MADFQYIIFGEICKPIMKRLSNIRKVAAVF